MGFLELLKPPCKKAEIKLMQMPVGVHCRVMGAEELWSDHNAMAVTTIYGSLKPANFIRILSSE